MRYDVEYLPDSAVDEGLDKEIRNLLCRCFTKNEDVVFKERRYFKDPYPHRWVIRNEKGDLIAHIGVHEKKIETNGRSCRVAGFCEVCVDPDYRGRGLVKMMLRTAEKWLVREGHVFALLFGDPKVYGSSEYSVIKNLSYDKAAPDGSTTQEPVEGMAKPLQDEPWPSSQVHLIGNTF